MYEASAGSGKTFQLALEYIALALSNDSPKYFTSILAVTFTNKATTEMKDRILEQLYNLAHGGLDRNFLEAICAHTGISAKVLQKRALQTLEEIIHDYDHFRVETIDSFFQSLLSNLAHELNLAKGFNIDLDLNEVVSCAVDRLLLAISDLPETENSKEKQETNRVCRLIVDYMEEHIQNDKGWKIGNELKSFAQENLFNEVYLHNEETINQHLNNSKNTPKLNAFKQLLRKDIDNNKAKCRTQAEQVLQLLEQPLGSADPKNLKAYKKMRGCCQQLILGDLSEPNYGATFEKAKDNSKALLKKDLQTQPEYVNLAQAVTDGLQSMEAIRKQVAEETITCELVLSNLGPLCLLSVIGKEVEQINIENGTFMLAKTPDLFNKMVGKEDSSFVFERAGTTFKHILIDEFQDTSQMQWDNFKKLLVENLSEGDECMLVGDVKQSIYRWRGGDWKILGNIKENMKHIGQVDMHTLGTNYRSCKEVVEFNNCFFKHCTTFLDQCNKNEGMDAENENGVHQGTIPQIYNHVEQQVKKNAETGYVRLFIDKSKDTTNEDIMDDVYKQIVELRNQNVPYDQMGILVRKKKEASAFIDYFSKHYPEIPLTSDEAFRLSASPAVNLLIYALKLIIEVKDFVAEKKSQEKDLTNQEITSKENFMAKAVCQQHALALQLDPQHTKECLNRICSEYLKWLNTPLFEVCQQLVLLFELPQAEAQGNGQSAYLFSFFDKLIEYLDEHPSDIEGFTAYWDEVLCNKSIAVNIQDSIFIMTIHASKGLERHTILIPFCHWELESNYPDDIIWCETGQPNSPFNFLPVVPVKTYASKKVKSSQFKADYNHEHLMQRIDSLNELYVAFTRARNNLLVWSTKQHRTETVFKLIENFVDSDSMGTNVTKDNKQDETKGYEVHTFGELLPFKPKKVPSDEQKTGCEPTEPRNPLVIEGACKEEIKFNNWLTDHMVFKQSHRSKAFIEELSEKDETQTDQSKLRQKFIDKGILLHELFSLINHASDLNAALCNLMQQGLITDKQEEAEIRTLVTKRLANSRVQRWFNYPGRVYTECNLLKRHPDSTPDQHKVKTLRPDRVMVNEQEAIVVDYKFGNPNEKYLTQVREYMECLRQMGYTQVKGYLWFVFSNNICEVE